MKYYYIYYIYYQLENSIILNLTIKAATDIHHHFVQRWNHAYFSESSYHPHYPTDNKNNLPFPEKLSPFPLGLNSEGDSMVQVLRTIRYLLEYLYISISSLFLLDYQFYVL
jgi:hypothetical protein